MSAVTIDAGRLFVAAYLVVLALAAALGRHRPLLSYPFRVGYSLVRLLLLVLTAKRVRLVPVTTRRRGVRKLRKLHGRISRPRGAASTVNAAVLGIQDWQAVASDEPSIDEPQAAPEHSPEGDPEYVRPDFEDGGAWNLLDGESDDPFAESEGGEDEPPPPYRFD